MEFYKNNHVLSNPCMILETKFNQMDEINKNLDNEINKTLVNYENKLRILEEKLKILNPDELLEKGYVVKDSQGKAKNIIILVFLAIVIILLILLSLK